MLNLDEVERKTKKRKAKEMYCDMSTGWHSDWSGAPVIDMCKNTLVKFIPEYSWGGVYLCEEHFASQTAKLRQEQDAPRG